MKTARRDDVSRALSYYLRHRPDLLGVEMDTGGWVNVEELLARFTEVNSSLTMPELVEVIVGNDKQRFALDTSGKRIRASQGHSVPVDLGLEDVSPPAVLYHGTNERAWETIQDQGLLPMRRHDVHLSATRATALTVGARRRLPIVLTVDAEGMEAAGFSFRVTANGVWLTSRVPPRFLSGM